MIGKLKTVVLDAADIAGLATFYTEITGGTKAYEDDDWIAIQTPDGWRIGFQPAPDHVRPQWPGQDHPQQAHLDLMVPDLELATAQAVGLGATLLSSNESFNTIADLAGHPLDLCLRPDNSGTTVMGLMLDCPDAAALSRFYSSLLGLPITYEGEGAAMVGTEADRPLMFQQVADYSAPRWPDPAYPQQIHLDIDVDDIEVAEPAVLALGATRLEGGGETFRVYADPVGKPFCFVW